MSSPTRLPARLPTGSTKVGRRRRLRAAVPRLLTIVLPCCWGPGAMAAPDRAAAAAGGPAGGDGITLLQLSATGTVSVTPDLLVAQLNGEDRAADPAAAQRALDRRMAAARTAAAQAGIAVRLRDYQADREQDAPNRPASWVARQTLELRGTDAAALLALVGRLQAQGLAVGGLDWMLAPATRDAATGQAEDAALRALRRRAEQAATALGLRAGRFREVRLGEDAVPRPRPLMRMMAMAAAPAPDATRSDQEVEQTASATVELLPP